MRIYLAIVWISFLSVSKLAAVSPDKTPTSDPSPEAERAGFTVHPDFEVSLFADETLGIAKPVAIQWDARGRLWVLGSTAYAQVAPGVVPDDKLYILEDTNEDGQADKSTLFTGGLNMPMGFALGNGGVWIAADKDLIFLRDTDGDDRADERRVVLTGFGTGDTHQNISNLVFDAGGFLYFSQGLHCFSQVETPWGVSRGDTAGFWRYDPRTMRLDPFGFPSMTSQNPCGIALDRWGALFVKSNGPHLCFATPGLVPTTHPRELMQFAQVGQTPGKSMGVDIVSSAHLPDWIENHAIIAGYFAREVSAIPLVTEGAGFAASLPVQLLFGAHESFRPVDIRQGPDGAIYIADWFNPIINHYQVSLRHPDRDYIRGRIWRLSTKGRPRQKPPALEKMGVPELVAQLSNPERWPREQARRLLTDHADSAAVVKALREANLPGEALVEGAGVLEALGALDDALLDRLQASDEPMVRAVVARIIARSFAPIPDADARLAKLLADSHPRPRLEAVIACANRSAPKSLALALNALDAGSDRFVEYSLAQAVFALESQWLPAVKAGTLTFAKPSHLAFVLDTHGDPALLELARSSLATSRGVDRVRLLVSLARRAQPADCSLIVADPATGRSPEVLDALIEAVASRGLRPQDPPDAILAEWLNSGSPEIAVHALKLAGLWKVAALGEPVRAITASSQASPELRVAAIDAISRIDGVKALPLLESNLDDDATPPALRKIAFESLARVDRARAAERLRILLVDERSRASGVDLLPSLLGQAGGPASLAERFESVASPDAATAQQILDQMNRTGSRDASLLAILNRAVGRQEGAGEFDEKRVAAIVAAVRGGEGDAKRGEAVYQLPQLACTGCHQIGDAGGVIGPALNGVGAGLPLDQIVESILWPARQIKEGFQAVSVTTKSGQAITGYIERESDDILWYRNTGTPWILPLEKKDIANRETIPTLMPPGLAASLSEEQLVDLVAYLASLKG